MRRGRPRSIRVKKSYKVKKAKFLRGGAKSPKHIAATRARARVRRRKG